MRKGNKYIILSFFLVALFFSLSSCGIPSYYIPYSGYITSVKAENSVTIKADLNKLSSSAVANPTASSPKIALYYQVIPNSIDIKSSGFEDVKNGFSNIYTNDKNVNRLPQQSLAYAKEYKDTSREFTTEYGIYQFTSNNELVSYIADSNDAKVENNVLSWKMDFSLVDRNLVLTLNDSDFITLMRFNSSSFGSPIDSYFSQSRGSAEMPVEFKDSINYSIRILMIVSTEFSNFNNIFNSKIIELVIPLD